MSDVTGNIKLLDIIDSGAFFNFAGSLVAKQLGWAIKPNNTPVAVKLANKIVVHSWIATNGLVLSSI